MFFKLNPTTGQPMYLQLMQQIRHAAETGALGDGDQLPGIRTLAEELVVVSDTNDRGLGEIARHVLSTPGHPRILDEHYPNHEPGNGPKTRVPKARTVAEEQFLGIGTGAGRRVATLIEDLRDQGLLDDEIRRAFEAELLRPARMVTKR